jgi:hypothetical protein
MAKEVSYPEIEGTKPDVVVPLHYHNGVDSPFIDKQNKKRLNIWSDYACIVNGTGLSLTNSSFTRLSFSTEVLDLIDMHRTDLNPQRLTMQVGGAYRITGYIRFADNTTGDRAIAIYKNGVTTGIIFYSRPDGSGHASITFDYTLTFSASDYIELYAYQSSGGALDASYVQVSCQLIASI